MTGLTKDLIQHLSSCMYSYFSIQKFHTCTRIINTTIYTYKKFKSSSTNYQDLLNYIYPKDRLD